MVNSADEPPPNLKRPARTGAFDIWLTRAGTFSNIVLAVFAVFAFFYTLVPLYRLAATDNALAQKEIELADAQTNLDAIYVQVRAYSVRSFLLASSPKCTGLVEPPESPRAAGPSGVTSGVATRATTTKPLWWRLLTADVRACLLKDTVDSEFLRDLRPDDREYFLAAFRQIAEEIVRDQHQSLSKAESAADDARRNPGLLPEEGEYAAAMRQILARSGVRYEEDTEKEFQRGVDRLRFKIALDWGDRSRRAMLALDRIHWPKYPEPASQHGRP